jgi:hypothetical protein
MTAKVTPPFVFDKFDNIAPVNGDAMTRLNYGLMGVQRPAGQLWERVAETTPNVLSRQYSLRLMGATLDAYQRVGERDRFDQIKRMQGAPVGNYGSNGPRVVVDGEYTAPRHASGVIRAGQRVK